MKCLKLEKKPGSNPLQSLAKTKRIFGNTTLLLLALLIVTPAIVFVVKVSGQSGGSPLIISEFRVRGPNGANDEFVEIYNNSNPAHVVASSDGSAGYAIAASDGIVRCVIPNGTVIPGRGHFLCANTIAYSLAAYPAGNGTTATPDVSFTTNINDNAGIALFSTSNPANFNLGTRFDAVGSTSEANTLYKEGAGYPALIPFSIDYSFYRSYCLVSVAGADPVCTPGDSGVPQDTNDNAVDFVFVDTNGTSAGAGQRLGAPGPENLSSPKDEGEVLAHSRFDPAQPDDASPNVVRDFTSDPPNNSTFGTLSIRRTWTNNTGQIITRLRFRVAEIETFPAPGGTADLRPRTSVAVVGMRTDGSTALVEGTTLEQPPSQPNGGGFNSSLSAGTVNLFTPLPPGGSIIVQFLMGIQQTGCYKVGIFAESLTAGPAGGSDLFVVAGNTDGSPDPCPGVPTPTPTPTPSPSPSPTPCDGNDPDGDGLGNPCDPDDDNDGVLDGDDNCRIEPNPGQRDTDGDGLGDRCDPDNDGDGVPDGQDNCPLTPNANQRDSDNDGIGDRCDSDDDNDGVPDDQDNCQFTSNPNQRDTDGDGVGDRCDSDDDNDGVVDAQDNCPLVSNPNQRDSDGDGIGDKCESSSSAAVDWLRHPMIRPRVFLSARIG